MAAWSLAEPADPLSQLAQAPVLRDLVAPPIADVRDAAISLVADVAPLAGRVVARVDSDVVAPLARGVIVPVVRDVVAPVAGAVVDPLVDDVVGDGIVSPLKSMLRPRVAPALLGAASTPDGGEGGGPGPVAAAAAEAQVDGLAVVPVPGGGMGHGRISRSPVLFPGGTDPVDPAPAPVSAVPVGGAGPGSASGASGSSGVSAVLAGRVISSDPTPGGVVREREMRPASVFLSPVQLPG